jgi:hypothetical protein
MWYKLVRLQERMQRRSSPEKKHFALRGNKLEGVSGTYAHSFLYFNYTIPGLSILSKHSSESYISSRIANMPANPWQFIVFLDYPDNKAEPRSSSIRGTKKRNTGVGKLSERPIPECEHENDEDRGEKEAMNHDWCSDGNWVPVYGSNFSNVSGCVPYL